MFSEYAFKIERKKGNDYHFKVAYYSFDGV